jgi:3-deoxy-D-manno-octulosonic-acid transferase
VSSLHSPATFDALPISFGMRFYRGFFRMFFRAFGKWVLGPQRWEETVKGLRRISELSGVFTRGSKIWFHAASVGELESLWPLVERASANSENELVITVFSGSVWNHVHRNARKLENTPAYVGYSPVEGFWMDALAQAKPNLFITAKYEAWPEIWNSLALLGVPLAIVGAKPRSSLLWAKRILRIFSGRLPELLFFSFDRENERGLLEAFPSSTIHYGSDPRWDRVFARARSEHPRVRELALEFADLPRPWGIVGSAWSADINRFDPRESDQIPGTLWVVPHRIDPKSISEIEILLRERGWTPVRTGSPERIRPAGRIALLVDEMGFLTELYSVMDWAFVGGGFGSGIHSTIEPSIYGLPIAGGPRGLAKFDEIGLLVRQGQMKILSDFPDGNLIAWIRCVVAESVNPSLRNHWKLENQRHLDASKRTWAILEKTLKPAK